MSTFIHIIAQAIVNVPVCLILLYVFNRKKWRSIPLTIIIGTIISEIWRYMHQANYRSGIEVYLSLAVFTMATVFAFGLIKLKDHITKREEAKYSDQQPPES